MYRRPRFKDTVYGTSATKFHDEDEEYDIMLRLDEPHRVETADLARRGAYHADGRRIRLIALPRLLNGPAH